MHIYIRTMGVRPGLIVLQYSGTVWCRTFLAGTHVEYCDVNYSDRPSCSTVVVAAVVPALTSLNSAQQVLHEFHSLIVPLHIDHSIVHPHNK